MIKKWLCFGILFFSAFSLIAQSDEIIDRLLTHDQAGFGDSAYIVLVGAGIVDENASPGDAAAKVAAQGWRIKEKSADSPIRLDEFSLLVMQAFNIKGGLLYRLFPVPRYAFREFTYLGFIPKEQNPYRYISGQEVLHLTGKTLAFTGMKQGGEK